MNNLIRESISNLPGIIMSAVIDFFLYLLAKFFNVEGNLGFWIMMFGIIALCMIIYKNTLLEYYRKQQEKEINSRCEQIFQQKFNENFAEKIRDNNIMIIRLANRKIDDMKMEIYHEFKELLNNCKTTEGKSICQKIIDKMYDQKNYMIQEKLDEKGEIPEDLNESK